MITSQGFRDLKVYQLAFKLATEIFNDSKHFPVEERYSLTEIKFVARQEALQRTSVRDTARSVILKCL